MDENECPCEAVLAYTHDLCPAPAATPLGRRRQLGGASARKWAAWLLLAFVATGLVCARATANQFVLLDFNLSLNPTPPATTRFRDTIFIELFDDRPLSRDNFLAYVNSGAYDGSLFHRLARNFVLQGGGFYPHLINEPNPNVQLSLDPTALVDLDGNPATPNPTVNNEFGNLPFRSNLAGTLAMAKQAGNPDSASSNFFFNLADNHANLDTQNGGFTVFGQVVGDGMALINAFNNLSLANLNPDTNDDGVRDAGPFFTSNTDAVPVSAGGSLLVLQDAEHINYWGSGTVTEIPASGLTISTLDTFIDTGAIFAGTGALTIGAGRTLGVREGGSLPRTLINQGVLAPGLRLGSITLQDYQQAASGLLEIQLNGTVPDTGHDRVVVAGTAQLNGTLEIVLSNNFAPAPGNTFTVLTANAITGNFSSVVLPQLAAGRVWDVDVTPTAVTLSVANADFNHDGIVNAADYTVWRNARGTTVPTAYAGADANGDLAVNLQDYVIWKDNYGNTDGGASGSGSALVGGVPEPASGLLFLCGVMGVTLKRYSKIRHCRGF